LRADKSLRDEIRQPAIEIFGKIIFSPEIHSSDFRIHNASSGTILEAERFSERLLVNDPDFHIGISDHNPIDDRVLGQGVDSIAELVNAKRYVWRFFYDCILPDTKNAYPLQLCIDRMIDVSHGIPLLTSIRERNIKLADPARNS
jgi:hypothetical protein